MDGCNVDSSNRSAHVLLKFPARGVVHYCNHPNQARKYKYSFNSARRDPVAEKT